MRWLVALLLALLVLVATGLLPEWGRWYSWDFFHGQQTEALLRGQLALSNDPSDLIHNACWSERGVHQVSGLGIPFWRLPFHVIAKICRQPAFPDRLILGLFIALAIGVILETVANSAIELRPANSQLSTGWLIGLGSILILLAFPPFLNLLRSLGGVYEEVLAYVYPFGLLLVCGLTSLVRRPTWARFWTLCALAGFGGLIRPTLVFYGIMTVLAAGFVMGRAHAAVICPKDKLPTVSFLHNWRFWLGVALFIAGGMVLWGTNLLRFGDGLEFGHRLNVHGGRLLGSVYATRFDHAFTHEPFWRAARELFGALFLVENSNGSDFYAHGFFSGQSPTLRWRHFYFTTYNLAYIGLVALAWAAGLVACWRTGNYKSQTGSLNRVAPMARAGIFVRVDGFHEAARAKDAQPHLERHGVPQSGTKDGLPTMGLLALWSLFTCVLLALFYLRSPVISSRYMMDFAPAIATAMVVAWWWIAEAVCAWKPQKRWALFALFGTLLGWLGWEIRQGKTVEAPRTLTWQEVVQRQEQQREKRRRKDLPFSYCLGDDLAVLGIPFNGEGWAPQNGAVMPCVILFVDYPEFLELDLVPAPGIDIRREDAEHTRAKVGLEFLKRESIERTADGWRLRFAGPTRPRYQYGIQPVFIATVPKENLADDHTPWMLKQVNWRSPTVRGGVR